MVNVIGLFRETILRDCAICGKELIVELRRPHFNWDFWKWKIISKHYYWGSFFNPLDLWDTASDEVRRAMEYWECPECYYETRKEWVDEDVS